MRPRLSGKLLRRALVAGVGCAFLYVARAPIPPRLPITGSPPVWATDVMEHNAGPLPIGEAAKPFKGQKEPPCARGLEVEFAKACWIPHESRPPCPYGAFEGAGRCLVPVKAASRPPTSLRPTP